MAELDHVDYSIISLLQEDGRMPMVEIARRIGVSEGTARRRLANLIEDEVIRVAAVANHIKLGFPFRVRFALIIEIDKFKEIAEALVKMPQIRFAYFRSGVYDVSAEGWFRTMDELVDFVVDQLSTISGVQKIETSYVQKEIKRAHFRELDILDLLDSERRLTDQEKA